jgi:hypothetical protein
VAVGTGEEKREGRGLRARLRRGVGGEWSLLTIFTIWLLSLHRPSSEWLYAKVLAGNAFLKWVS